MPDTKLQQALELAGRHHRSGRLAEAEAVYRQVLAHDPDSATASHLLGIVLAQSGRFEEAIRLITRAVQLDPSNSDYHANLGTVLQESGRPDLAIPAYRHALSLAPDKPEIHNNLGNAFRRTGSLPEAIDAFHQALRLRPDYFEAALHLGIAHFEAGDYSAADAYRQSLRLRPNSPEAHHDLGQALLKLGRLDEAARSLNSAHTLFPQSPAIALDLCNALRESGRLDESIAAYRRAIALNPEFADAHYGLAWSLLLKGDLREGLAQYEWRHRLTEASGAIPLPDKPRWDGSPLGARPILLQAEQGFGDTFFALRYLPRIVERQEGQGRQGGQGGIIVRAPQPLVRLLQHQPGISRVFPFDQPLPDVAVQCQMMSLPLLFETDISHIRADVPYISAPAQRVELWRTRLDQPPRLVRNVGLVWAGGATPPGRSIPFPLLADLLRTPSVQFHSLQKGPQAAELTGHPVQNWDSQITDFADTAALIANLDLVITIDTAVAHLAGAMGRPVWVMLKYAADWRWFLNRTDSPWYPTMRLFRQPAPGDWPGVVGSVSHALLTAFA